MGVQGLWELLAPVGRRVSVETLAGKKLAIDASIWMVQFMKAMRDERGEMVRNAHILGFFRRICKLLFLRAKPVFVFDGGTPALKRRTVMARKRLRDKAQAKIRKTAEKLLLNHLKARKLEELAEEIRRKKIDGDDPKGKKVVFGEDSTPKNPERARDQEALDAMLAASLAAEDDHQFDRIASNSVVRGIQDDDTSDDEELIYPVTEGKVDPAVLAALPPSMQLDLLVQMRERLMAENRQKYEKVKKAPGKFSEMQIQAYLKTVAFRREIDEVQKSAGGKGVGGISSCRIASEPNREFIFSSSFTGDKQLLRAVGNGSDLDAEDLTEQSDPSTSASAKHVSSQAQRNPVKDIPPDASISDFGNGIETYIDEQGRVRVSKHRSMGLRMTRDLQWNLDMMKEMEGRMEAEANNCTIHDKESEIVGEFRTNVVQFNEALEGTDGVLDKIDENLTEVDRPPKECSTRGQKGIEVSFFEDELYNQNNDDPDDLFTNLVVGSLPSDDYVRNPLLMNNFQNLSVDSVDIGLCKESCSMDAKYIHVDHDNNDDLLNAGNRESTVGYSSDDGDVDWEDAPIQTSVPVKTITNACKLSKDEEADIQEAIRRSLEDYQTLDALGSELQRSPPDDIPVIIPLQSSGNAYNNTSKMDMRKSVASQDQLTNDFEDNGLNLSKSVICTPTTLTVGGTSLPDRQDVKSSHPEVSIGEQTSFLDETVTSNDLMGITNLNTPMESQKSQLEKVCHLDSIFKESTTVLMTSVHTSSTIGSDKVENMMNDSHDVLLKDSDNLLSCPSESESGPIKSHESYQAEELINNHSVQLSGGDFAPSESEDGPFKPLESYDAEALINNRFGQLSGGDFPPYGDVTEASCYNEKFQDDVLYNKMAAEERVADEMEHLRQENMDLGDEQRKLERNAESVSSEMFTECQELLQMFGLPYIIAPMEAEAQCAYMECIGLVDGVVTDDSDAFLFGARSIYKNIFDNRKYVETYFIKDVEAELGLTREKLIHMALLLGSDYTEGVSGIGIVNAIEVVHAFPEEDGLQKFREWFDSPDPTIVEKVHFPNGRGSRKKPEKENRGSNEDFKSNPETSTVEKNVHGNHEDAFQDNITRLKQLFVEKHRNVSKNWHMPSSFPSKTVISAYTSPQVDKSSEPFSWGKPDLSELRSKLCWEKFGWPNQKADELLLPVLKEYNKHETQLRLEAFYTFNERFAKIRSQRIQKAVKGLSGKRSSDLMVDSDVGEQKGVSTLTSGSMGDGSTVNSKGNSGSVANKRTPRGKAMKQQSGRGSKRKFEHGGCVGTESFAVGEDPGSNKVELEKQERGRGRGRAKKQKELPGVEVLESGSSDDSDIDRDLYEDDEKLSSMVIDQSSLRRSQRPRKPVVYAVDNLDTVDSHEKHLEEIDQELITRMDTNKRNSTEILPEDTISKDYLFTGGGFCVEDDSNACGVDQDSCQELPLDELSKSPTIVERSPVEQGNSYRECDLGDSSAHTPSTDRAAQTHPLQSGTTLKAMPSLRRRRKRI